MKYWSGLVRRCLKRQLKHVCQSRNGIDITRSDPQAPQIRQIPTNDLESGLLRRWPCILGTLPFFTYLWSQSLRDISYSVDISTTLPRHQHVPYLDTSWTPTVAPPVCTEGASRKASLPHWWSKSFRRRLAAGRCLVFLKHGWLMDIKRGCSGHTMRNDKCFWKRVI